MGLVIRSAMMGVAMLEPNKVRHKRSKANPDGSILALSGINMPNI
jgi:hypothetical protein